MCVCFGFLEVFVSRLPLISLSVLHISGPLSEQRDGSDGSDDGSGAADLSVAL